MKIINGLKLGGLQQKIFDLMLLFIIAFVAVYAAVSVYQQHNLAAIVEDAAERQQESISAVSQETMRTVLETSMSRTTALQAYIANDLFADVKTDVETLQAFARELFANASAFPPHPFYAPDPAKDGIPSVQFQHEAGVDPNSSGDLGLAANMSEVMLAMFKASDKLDSCFVATTDGCILFVDDRSGSYIDENGSVETFPVRQRTWYTQAVGAGELIFTGVELDAFTDIAGLVCAAPVYVDGKLACVVGADIFLTSISNYVQETSSESGFLCVVNQNGQVLFSPQKEGIFRAELSDSAPDLRRNGALGPFITEALKERTGLTLLQVDGREYYLTGAPMETLGWAVISVVDKEATNRPTEAMLKSYEDINAGATATFNEGAARSGRTVLVMTVLLALLAIVGALVLAYRIVKPIEHMTKRINSLSGSDTAFQMEDVYRTDDEIEILAESFASLSKKTRDYITQITEITAEKERIGTELALATRIQADMLPNIFPAFPERPDFDIYAVMDPAKEVGGDFYDFFLIDETHLALVIADVSGKGVPAALFMMVSKILVQNYAMTGRSPAEVLRAVNNQICSNNREEMFVTVWLGILDTATGKITAANAGHEYPTVMEAGGEFRLIKDKHGLVIGAMEGIRYREYELQLQPGGKLFVYTDGVPEATNAENELFGTERMLRALNKDTGASPEQVLRNVRRAVDDFVLEAEQFDDLTMLCLEYKGDRKIYKEITVPAETDKLDEVMGFIETELEKAECSPKARMQLAVAAEEIFVNIASYAYAPGKGDAVVRFELDEADRRATLTFIDNGVAFDPLEKPDPDVTLPASERQIGGLGIFMTKKAMDDMRYERTDGKNILTLVKKI